MSDTPTRVLVRVLGPIDVVAEGRPRALGSPHQRVVLAVLAVHGVGTWPPTPSSTPSGRMRLR